MMESNLGSCQFESGAEGATRYSTRHTYDSPARWGGFDLCTVKQGPLFRVAYFGMYMLVQVMRQAGVDVDTAMTSPDGEGNDELLRSSLTVEGWEAKPQECREIARKLSEHTPTSYLGFNEYLEWKLCTLSVVEMEIIEAFIDYCEFASSLGGFSAHGWDKRPWQKIP